ALPPVCPARLRRLRVGGAGGRAAPADELSLVPRPRAHRSRRAARAHRPRQEPAGRRPQPRRCRVRRAHARAAAEPRAPPRDRRRCRPRQVALEVGRVESAAMRVAIVGGPGIGKSTLLRQLGDLYHNGSYGEGEEGVWDPRVLEDIAAGRNPVGVTAYFAALYEANYRDAAENDRPGRVIFFEGARVTAEAHIAESPAGYHEGLRKVLPAGDAWRPDRTIVLTSSTDTIEKHITQRNRAHEDVVNMVRRFRLIDGEFRRLAPRYPNTVVVNRDRMEFHDRDSLKAIIAAARLPMFPEIPYARLE